MFEYYGNTHLQVRFISLIHRDFLISNGIPVPLLEARPSFIWVFSDFCRFINR